MADQNYDVLLQRRRDSLYRFESELWSSYDQICRILDGLCLMKEDTDKELADLDVLVSATTDGSEARPKKRSRRNGDADDVEKKYHCVKTDVSGDSYYRSDWVHFFDDSRKLMHPDGMCFFRSSQYFSSVCVYVSGISPACSRLRFLDRVERFGRVIGIHVVVKSFPGNVRARYRYAGYGYVQFALPESAESMLHDLAGVPKCVDATYDDHDWTWMDGKYLTAARSKFEMDIERMLGLQWTFFSPRVSFDREELHLPSFGWDCIPDDELFSSNPSVT